jgi:hypothetical protein
MDRAAGPSRGCVGFSHDPQFSGCRHPLWLNYIEETFIAARWVYDTSRGGCAAGVMPPDCPTGPMDTPLLFLWPHSRASTATLWCCNPVPTQETSGASRTARPLRNPFFPASPLVIPIRVMSLSPEHSSAWSKGEWDRTVGHFQLLHWKNRRHKDWAGFASKL